GGTDVATTADKLYYGSALNKAKSTLTSNDLPSILAQQSLIVSGVTYKYDQYITLGNSAITFGTSGGDLSDPAVYVDMGTSTSSPVYNLTVVFNRQLNLSSSNVRGRTITLFGNDYTIGSNSVSSATASSKGLGRYGAGATQTLSEGTPVTVTVGGTEYTVEATFITSQSAVLLKVNGEVGGVALSAGDSDVIGGLSVYVKDVLYSSKESVTSQAVVNLGTQKIKLQHGQAVKVGEAETSIDNTLVNIVGDAGGISTLTISVAAQDSSGDYIASGESYTDPVFGTFKVAFNGLTPALDSADRDVITIDNSGNTGATVKFTDYRGNEKTVTFAYTGTTSSTWGPTLNSSSTRAYHVVEGEAVNENDYVLLTPQQESEFSHIFELADVSSVGTSSASIQLKDIFTDSTTTVYLTDSGYGSKTFYIDGQTYYVKNTTSSTNSPMAFYWGSGANAG
ncbi:MAG: hypothetical protein DRP27_09190, partial [Thermotogae bacterium]